MSSAVPARRRSRLPRRRPSSPVRSVFAARPRCTCPARRQRRWSSAYCVRAFFCPGTAPRRSREDEERMALCHELSHVKRADLWLGLVPAAAERLFFFHPLVRLASREYLLCREAACDAAVLDTLATTPQDYGRLLLTLGVSRHRSSLAVAGASSSFSMLKRRIAMLPDSSPSTVGRRVLSALVIAAAVTAAVPLRLTARAQAPAPAGAAARNHRPGARLVHHGPVTDLARAWTGVARAASRMRACCRPMTAQQESRGNSMSGPARGISTTCCSSTTTTRTCPVRSPTSTARAASAAAASGYCGSAATASSTSSATRR